MSSLTAKALIEKYLSGTCSKEEKAFVEDFYLQQMRSGTLPGDLPAERFKELMWERIVSATKPKRMPLWPRVAVAAAAILVITFGIWFFNTYYINAGQKDSHHAELVSGSKDIAPGKNTATLTLANGEIIQLSGAKAGVVVDADQLTYNDGTKVDGSHTEKTTMLTASTPRGGTYQVTLPDGTHVWLNADSKISFPSQFSGAKRKIFLAGEAYFEVAKNKKMPFIVESPEQQVEVLGTHFNINSYKDEAGIKTTLLEGSIKISALPDANPGKDVNATVILKPNQQATIRGNNKISIKEVDARDAVDWKEGQFVFRSESLQSILRRVSRWYDVEVVYEGNIPDATFTGAISRFDKISSVLELIETTKKVKFEVHDRKLLVKE